jgi:hypothetical protein
VLASGLAATATALALPSAGAGLTAPDRAEQTKYFRVTAVRYVREEADFGDDGRHSWDGHQTRRASWQLRAIVAWNGYALSVLKNAAVATSEVTVEDTRVSETRNGWVRVCDKFPAIVGQTTPWGTARSARVNYSRRGLLAVSPGSGFPWRAGCTNSENVDGHGMDGSFTYLAPAPGPARFLGNQSFSYYCSDDYEHSDPEHSFQGISKFSVTLSPMPASQLKARRKQLRDLIRKDAPLPTFPGGVPNPEPDPNAKDCS